MPASAAKRAEVAERRARVLQLRAAGWTYAQIAKREKLASAAAAATDVDRALQERKKLDDGLIGLVVTLELEKLDAIERSVQTVLARAATAIQNTQNGMPDTTGLTGSPEQLMLQCSDRLLKIAERRALLQGLDAATKRQPDSDEPTSPVEALRRQGGRKRGLVAVK